jgi:hypothetical protein
MKQYIVYVPQIESYTIITEEERDEYLKKLKKFSPKLTIDYGDDELPFYDLDRRIDEFTVSEATGNLKNAYFVEVEETAFGEEETLAKRAYKDYRGNKWALDAWFKDFKIAKSH